MSGKVKNTVRSMRYRMGRLLHAAIWVISISGGAVVFDYLYGSLSGITRVREDARQFRSEAAVLRTSTRAMVPNLSHMYRYPYRLEGEALIPDAEPRRFETTPSGTVAIGTAPTASGPRLLFLGGSTTECNEVDQPYRFPAVVERSLRESGAAVSVVNAGVRGHTTLDAVNTLINRPDLAGADVIVLMENINDRLRLAVRGGYGVELHDASSTSFAAVSDSAAAMFQALWEYLAYRSNVLFLLQSLPERFGASPDAAGGWITERTLDELPLPTSEAQRLYAQNLRLFTAVVRSFGKTPVLMTQPLGRHSAAQVLFNERVRSVAAETGTMLIDLDAVLPGDRGWAFLDDKIHLSNRGALAVGQLITARVASLIGVHYAAPSLETGLASLSALAETCRPPGNVQPEPPALYQILGDDGRYPSVSPDGRWLLFQTQPAAFDRIRVMRVADRRVFDLSPFNANVHERHPAFLDVAPDGFAVVFGSGLVGERDGEERLLVRSWPSGDTTALYADAELRGSIPTVSGRAVYFAGSKDQDGSRAPNLYRFDRDRHRVERLTSSPAEEWRPVATAAGDIFFISNQAGRFGIYRRDARSGTTRSVISSRADEWDPAVSPDGKWLAFASKRHGSWDIFLAPTDDPGALRRLTSLSGDEWDPSWHPNGRVLLFGSAQAREPKIMALCPFGQERNAR